MGEARSINCIVRMQLAVERPVLQKDGSLRAKAWASAGRRRDLRLQVNWSRRWVG